MSGHVILLSGAPSSGKSTTARAVHARDLTVEVPYIVATDRDARLGVALPVAAPCSLLFGPYPVTVQQSGVADTKTPWHRGSALALDLDLGGWSNDRRVILPGMPRLDGHMTGMSYGRGMYAPSPKPVEHLDRCCRSARGAHAHLRGSNDPRARTLAHPARPLS